MIRFLLRRFVTMAVTLLIISALVFFIIKLPPGDFLTNQIAELRAQGESASIAKAEFLIRQYGLDKPAWQQYLVSFAPQGQFFVSELVAAYLAGSTTFTSFAGKSASTIAGDMASVLTMTEAWKQMAILLDRADLHLFDQAHFLAAFPAGLQQVAQVLDMHSKVYPALEGGTLIEYISFYQAAPAELLAELAKRQRPDGSWLNDNVRWMEGDPNLVTGYALLTLTYLKPAK